MQTLEFLSCEVCSATVAPVGNKVLREDSCWKILNFINRKATCSNMLERRVKVNRKAAQHLNGRWTVRQVVRSRDYRSSLLDLIKVHVPVAWTMLEDCA